MIDCDHWSECKVLGGGCCAAGHYGGRPSLGVCGQCPHKTTGGQLVPVVHKGIAHYAAGAVKAAKAMTLPETDLSKGRLEICGGCDQWTGTTCKKCGCFTKLKVKIPEEKCPLGKW